MVRWTFVILLVTQAHFAASYLVPLDAQAQRTFGGLLKWVWPWSIGDRGLLGQITPAGFPLSGFFIAVCAAGVLILGGLSVARVWIPEDWWKPLAATGAVLSLALMVLFFGPTKLLPIVSALIVLAAVFGYWSPVIAS